MFILLINISEEIILNSIWFAAVANQVGKSLVCFLAFNENVLRNFGAQEQVKHKLFCSCRSLVREWVCGQWEGLFVLVVDHLMLSCSRLLLHD